ncbi:hypothetical protein Tco_0383641 [Tanacetum coccineum]
MDVHVHHEVPSQQTPIILTVPVPVIIDSSLVYSTVIPQSLPSFTPPPQQSTSTPPPITEAINPQSTFPDFASVFQFNNRVSALEKDYSLKRSRKDKDKDEDPSTGSDRGLKKRNITKDAEPTKGTKAKESQSSSSKGTKSLPKSSGKSVRSEEPEFEVADSDMPQDQEENPGNDDEEPKEKVASKRDWFTKPTQPQDPTDPNWKTFDELMSTPIDFSTYIMNGLKVTNLTQETMLGPVSRLLKGTRTNYVELEYNFEEYYKDLSEKLDRENPEGGDYPFDLTKPFPLVMSGNRQKVPVDYFFNNDLKYLQGGVSTMTYTTSITKAKDAQYDLPGIKNMVPNIWVLVKVAYDNHACFWDELDNVVEKEDGEWICFLDGNNSSGIKKYQGSNSSDGGNTGDGVKITGGKIEDVSGIIPSLESSEELKEVLPDEAEIVVRRADIDLYRFKEGDFPRLRINDIEDMLLLVKLGYSEASRRSSTGSQKLPEEDQRRNGLMRSNELYKFSDRTLTGLQTSLDDITKNIRMEYLQLRRWSILEKKRANITIKAIDKQLKKRRMMRSLKKFVGGRHYGTDLRKEKKDGRYFECYRLKDMRVKTKVDDWEFKGLFGVLLVDNVEEQRWKKKNKVDEDGGDELDNVKTDGGLLEYCECS